MKAGRGSRRCIALVVVAVGCVAPAWAAAGAWSWDYNLFVGQKTVGEKDWAPYEKYQEFGLEASWGKADQPLMFATDVYLAQDDEDESGESVESTALEVDLGLRKIWKLKKGFHPYFGAGVALVSADFESINKGQRTSDEDRAAGFWLGGGCVYRLGPHLNLGIALRVTPVRELNLDGEPRGGTSTSLGIVIGWGSAAAKDKETK